MPELFRRRPPVDPFEEGKAMLSAKARKASPEPPAAPAADARGPSWVSLGMAYAAYAAVLAEKEAGCRSS